MGQINDDRVAHMIRGNIPYAHIDDMQHTYDNFNPFNTSVIKYGSKHPSILAESNMKSAISITSVGTGSAIASDATIDSVLGMKPGVQGGCLLTGFTGFGALDTQGQMSFRISTNAISELLASTGSIGDVYTDNTYVYSHAPVVSGGDFGRSWMNISNTGQFESASVDVHITTEAHSLLNGDTTLVTISWTATTLSIYFNHRLHGTGTRTNPLADIYKLIWFGSLRGLADTATANTMQNAWFSDWVIATEPVSLTADPLTAQITVWGDSFVNQGTYAGRSNYFHNNCEDAMIGHLASRGILVTATTFIGTGGATIVNSGGNPMAADLPAVLATSPTIAVIQGGVNDAAQASLDPAFEADLDGHIAALLGGTAQYVAVGNSPTLRWDSIKDTPAHVANVAQVRQIMGESSIRNGSDLIKSYDMYKTMGEENNPPNTFEGQVTGLQDNLHLSAGGQLAWGNDLGATIYNILTGV